MPTSILTGPDGNDYEITHPAGASDAEILDYAKKHFGQPPSARAAAPAPTVAPSAPATPSHLGAALTGLGEGFGGIVQGAKYIGKELYETPSRIGQMIRDPSIIPEGAAQTGREAVAVATDPKALAAGAGGLVGGVGGAAAGATGYQFLHDLLRRLMGEEVTPQEMTRNITSTTASFAGPPALGKLGAKAAGAGVRSLARGFPGSGAALQQDVLKRARELVRDVPAPPVPEAPAALAARRAAAAGATDAETAAQQAAYQARLRQAQHAGIEKIREAGIIPYERNPYKRFEEPSQAAEALEMLKQSGTEGQIVNVRPVTRRGGIPVETIPVGTITEALGKTTDVLQPLIASWKLSPNPNLVKSAATLEKHLGTTSMTMDLPDVIRFMRDIGKLTTRGGEVGGAAGRLYKAAVADLEAHGTEAARAALDAAKQWKRKIAVETIHDALAKAIRSKAGELVPAPDNLLRVLQSPSTRAEKFFMKRIKESLSADEINRLITDLKSAAQMPKKPKKPTAPQTATQPQPPKITSLQEVLEAAKTPVEGGGMNVDLERVLKQLPSQGAAAREGALAEFLRTKMSSDDLATLRAGLEELQGVKRLTGGSPSYLERLPVYMVLAPLLSALGLGAAGGGGGAAATVIPASILAAEATTRKLKRAALNPTMQRALLRAYKNRIGQASPSLGGPTLGIASESTKRDKK